MHSREIRHHAAEICLTNQAPVLIEWPVNKQAASDQVFVGYGSPITAVVAVVAVIAQGKILVLRHGERALWLRQIITAQSIAPIRRLSRHHSGETKTLRDFSIDIEKRRIDPKRVAGQTSQAFDIKRRPGLRVLPDPEDMLCPENEDVASMRLHKIVAAFIHKNLVACVHRASGNNFAPMISPPRENVKIMRECFGWRINEKLLLLADQPRKREEEEKFPLLDLQNLIILTRDNIDIIAA